MKIEKINENQIRCTLTRSDLESRDIDIKELAYGNDKARKLFSDMVREACSQFEFSTDHVPIMIEAVPVPSDGLVILITKVDNPEELDPHFAKFAPSVLQHSELLSEDGDGEGFGGMLEKFRNILGIENPLDKASESATIGGPVRPSAPGEGKIAYAEPVPEDHTDDATRTFVFASMDEVRCVVRVVKRLYDGETSLYRNPRSGHLYLVIHKGENEAKTFNKICNTITEYGAQVKVACASENYYREHYETVYAGDAIKAIK